jgi:hypothetical protein
MFKEINFVGFVVVKIQPAVLQEDIGFVLITEDGGGFEVCNFSDLSNMEFIDRGREGRERLWDDR